MPSLDYILTRESVRDYEAKKIKDSDLNLILKSAMSGPSCVNSRDYAFIVIDDKKILNDIYNLLGPQAQALTKCSHAILILADTSRSFKQAKEYYVIDTSICAQNIMLSSNTLSIGSVMLGVWPQMERVDKLNSYFNLPENMITMSVIALGYKKSETKGKDHFEEDRIHYNKF